MVLIGFKKHRLGVFDEERDAYPYYLGTQIKLSMPQGENSKLFTSEEKGGRFFSIKTPKNVIWFDSELINSCNGVVTPDIKISLSHKKHEDETFIGLETKYKHRKGILSLADDSDSIVISDRIQNNYKKFVKILGMGVDGESMNGAVLFDKVYGLYMKNQNLNDNSQYNKAEQSKRGIKVKPHPVNESEREIKLSAFLDDSKIDFLSNDEDDDYDNQY